MNLSRRGFLQSLLAGAALAAGSSTGLLRRAPVEALPEPEAVADVKEPDLLDWRYDEYRRLMYEKQKAMWEAWMRHYEDKLWEVPDKTFMGVPLPYVENLEGPYP